MTALSIPAAPTIETGRLRWRRWAVAAAFGPTTIAPGTDRGFVGIGTIRLRAPLEEGTSAPLTPTFRIAFHARGLARTTTVKTRDDVALLGT